jgi:hypothetical protein
LEGWVDALIAKKQPDQALAKFKEAKKYAPNWGWLHLALVFNYLERLSCGWHVATSIS